MKVLDLFSGIGGFSLGLERSGMRTIAFCEIEEYPRRVLRKHWPDVPIFEDVRKLRREDLPEQPDVIAGGFPCKQTSVAAAIHAKRDGLRGQDSGLWFEYLRLVRDLRPTWAIVENPEGVKAWQDQITGSMEDIGYRVEMLALSASDFGLPHRRRRCLFVANRDGKRLEVTRPQRPPAIAWIKRLTAAGGSWLGDTPGAGRGDDGIPHRVDRLRALGNAVVPQIPEMIGRAIMAVEAA